MMRIYETKREEDGETKHLYLYRGEGNDVLTVFLAISDGPEKTVINANRDSLLRSERLFDVFTFRLSKTITRLRSLTMEGLERVSRPDPVTGALPCYRYTKGKKDIYLMFS